MSVSFTFLGVALLALAVAVAPLVSDPDYDWMAHSVSLLAGQGMPNAFLVQIGLASHGAMVTLDAMRRLIRRQWAYLPFVVMGVAMIGAALFQHAPLDQTLAYNAEDHRIHGHAIDTSAAAFVLGTLACLFTRDSLPERLPDAVAATSGVLIPLLIINNPGLEGLLQRGLFLITFAWLVMYLPPRGGLIPRQ